MAGVVKQLVVVAVLAGGGWAAFDWWRSNQEAAAESAAPARQAPGVVVAPARIDRIERTVSAVGAARPARAVELAALSEGRVVELGFDGGERVSEGQVLMRLDDRAQAASLQEAEASLVRARNAFDRAETLLRQNRIPQAEYDNARAELTRTEAVVDRARRDLEERTLVAPFDGVASFRSVDVGAVVRANTTIAELVDLTALDVDFAIPERFYGEVRAGASVRAATDIFQGETFEGALTSVGSRIDTVSRSFTARARIPNPDLRLPGDAFMRVTLVLNAREAVLAPEEAVAAEGGATFVYVVADDRVQRRPVRVGAPSNGRADIGAGGEVG
ncbi:MAG: efflux RND transporter periplasmic adaptor subunit, partial [Rubrimonas sp.]